MKDDIKTYLTGKCLVSMPNMTDECFAKSLIYICSHSQEGAMGFVINKKVTEFSFADIVAQLPIKPNLMLKDIELHQGGPLEKIRGFVLHSTDYIKDDTVVVDNGIAISSSIDVISDIAEGVGPEDNIIALGYASWSAEQLENEIKNNDWLIVPATPDLLFKTKDEDKWAKALSELHVDINRLSCNAGHA